MALVTPEKTDCPTVGGGTTKNVIKIKDKKPTKIKKLKFSNDQRGNEDGGGIDDGEKKSKPLTSDDSGSVITVTVRKEKITKKKVVKKKIPEFSVKISSPKLDLKKAENDDAEGNDSGNNTTASTPTKVKKKMKISSPKRDPKKAENDDAEGNDSGNNSTASTPTKVKKKMKISSPKRDLKKAENDNAEGNDSGNNTTASTPTKVKKKMKISSPKRDPKKAENDDAEGNDSGNNTTASTPTKVKKKMKISSPKRDLKKAENDDTEGNDSDNNATVSSPTRVNKEKKIKAKMKSLETSDKKKKKKKKNLDDDEEEDEHPELLLERALQRICHRTMENPAGVVLLSGDAGIGKMTWVETETQRLMSQLQRDGKVEQDDDYSDDSEVDDSGNYFPVICRGQCEKPPFIPSTKVNDDDSDGGEPSTTTSSFFNNGCSLSRPPMHAITEVLNDLIRVLTTSSTPVDEGMREISNDNSIYGGKVAWAKWFSETLGIAEATYLASTGLVPELGVLLDLPGFSTTEDGNSSNNGDDDGKLKKRPPISWDWNSPYKFHRSCIAVRDLLRTVSESRHPVIMVINNLDQADEDTCRLLSFLVAGDPRNLKEIPEANRMDVELSSGGDSDFNSRLLNFLLVGINGADPKNENRILHALESSFLRRQELDWQEQQRQILQDQEQGRQIKSENEFREQSHLTKISLGRFKQDKIEELVRSTLHGIEEEEDVRELAKTIREWTGGNVFYALQVLDHLKEEGLISSSPAHEWDIKEVRAQASQDHNSAIELTAIRINRLPKTVRFAMINASALRQTQISFSPAQLFRLFKAAYVSSGMKKEFPFASSSELEKALDAACDLKFMRRLISYRGKNSNRWGFSHTLIRDAAYSLFNQHERKMEIHVRLGTEASALAVDTGLSLSSEERDAFKFLAADQLAIAEEILERDRNKAALLLVETAEMCVSKAAFCTAIRYLRVGIGMLERNEGRFTAENHGTCVRMHLLLARISSTCYHNNNEAQKSIREVLENTKTLKDKVMIRQVEIGILVGQKKFQEAFEKTLATLELLGEEIPRTGDFPEIISRQFQKLVQRSRRKDSSRLFQPPPCTDKKVFDVMSLLSDLIEISRLSGKKVYQELAMIRIMNISLTAGFTRQYPLSFAYFGESLMKQAFAADNFTYAKEGYRMGQVCEKLARVNDFYGGQSLAIFHFYISHWRRPYRRSLGQVLSIYNAQLKSGDYSHIDFAMFTYIQYHLASGHDLARLDDNLQLFDVLYQDYKMKDHWKIQLSQRFVANMLGETSNPFLLLGYTEEDQKSKINQMEERGEKESVQFVYFLVLFTSVLFHNHDLSKSCLDEIVVEEAIPIWKPWIICFQCLTDIVFIHKVETKDERKKLKESIEEKKEQLIDWYNEGAVNCSAMISLIEAEFTVEDPPNKKPLSALRIQKLYDDAIAVARKQELKHIEAFCLERASMRFEDANAKSLSVEYIAKAHQCYVEWNAIAKAVDIEERHAFKLKLSKREKKVGEGYVRQNSGLRYNPKQTIGGGHKEIKSINIKDAKKAAKKVKGIVFGKSHSTSSEKDRDNSIRDKFARMSSFKTRNKAEAK